jgi:hypothetical protein
MLKQEYPEAIMKLLGLKWDANKHISTGSTVTTKAWEDIYNRIFEISEKAKELEKCFSRN